MAGRQENQNIRFMTQYEKLNKYMRNSAGVTKWDHKRIESILNSNNETRLQHTLKDAFRKPRNRINRNRIPRQILCYTPLEKRSISHPAKR